MSSVRFASTTAREGLSARLATLETARPGGNNTRLGRWTTSDKAPRLCALALCAAAFVLGCRPQQHASPQTPGSDAGVGVTKPEIVAEGGDERGDDQEALRVVRGWNDALNTKDIDALNALYGSYVTFYGWSMKREVLLEKKRQALAASPTFRQVLRDVRFGTTESPGVYSATFLKASGPKGSVKSVAASLTLSRETGALRIVAESDEASDDAAFYTSRCVSDADCPPEHLCTWVAGEVWSCTRRPTPATCPKGQLFLERVGGCWTPCDTDGDCEEGLCCLHDANSPHPICLGRCGTTRP